MSRPSDFPRIDREQRIRELSVEVASLLLKPKPKPHRKWDIAKTCFHQVDRKLDEGWEPFAVVQREPNTRKSTSGETVYLRRPVGNDVS